MEYQTKPADLNDLVKKLLGTTDKDQVYAEALQALLNIIKAEACEDSEGHAEGEIIIPLDTTPPGAEPAWDLSGKSMHAVRRVAHYEDSHEDSPK